MSWNDVQAFIHKLNAQEGGERYRLPTEAEWEYAARAGSTTAYSFGNDPRQLDAYAWYNSTSGYKAFPIGQRWPNAWGLYDMYGNIWEWVQDWYGPYPLEAITDPQGPRSGSLRVLRGGSWLSLPETCRSAYRYKDAPASHSARVGFRLLRTAS